MQHIRLIVFDLDYLIFNCSILKVKALRQSLIPFAEAIPQDVRLPDAMDAEEGYQEYGSRWTQFLQIGLDQEILTQLEEAYRINEERLVQAGAGLIFEGIEQTLKDFQQQDIRLALGAESSRDYMLAVTDRHRLDNFFQIALCTEEFGSGSTDEMLEEIMHFAEVNPSETLALGTRPAFFGAARGLDVLTIGCGWGIHQHGVLANAHFQSLTPAQMHHAVRRADAFVSQFMN